MAPSALIRKVITVHVFRREDYVTLKNHIAPRLVVFVQEMGT